VLGWNFNVFLGRSASASPVLSWIAETLFLQQAWGMFAQPATRTGWLVMEGKLRDGATIDLLSAGGAAPGSFAGEDPAAPGWAKPDLVALQFKNDRWRIFLSRAVRGTDTQAQLLLYGRYLCREWNGSHTGDRQLETFELWFLARPIGEGTAHDYAKDLIWSHSCFASTANLNRSP
jgi:hypothetical protein